MNRKISDLELHNLIHDTYECPYVDYKVKYELSKNKNFEILLDIMAFANVTEHLNDRKFIIVGVNEGLKNEIVGVEAFIDSSNLQQLVNSNISPKIELYAYTKEIEGKYVGIIEIRNTNTEKRRNVYTIIKKYGKLLPSTYYVRTQSSKERRNILELSFLFNSPLLIVDDIRYKVDSKYITLSERFIYQGTRSELLCIMDMNVKNNTNADVRIEKIEIETKEKKKDSKPVKRGWLGDLYEYIRRVSRSKIPPFVDLSDVTVIIPQGQTKEFSVVFEVYKNDRYIVDECFMDMMIDCGHFVIHERFDAACFYVKSQNYLNMKDYEF